MEYMDETKLFGIYVHYFSKEYENLITIEQTDKGLVPRINEDANEYSGEEGVRLANDFETIKRLLKELDYDCEANGYLRDYLGYLKGRLEFFATTSPKQLRTLYAEGRVYQSWILCESDVREMEYDEEPQDFVELTVRQAEFISWVAYMITQTAVKRQEEEEEGGIKF
jgi:hypothetical protein